MERKTSNHVFLRMFGKVEMSRDWFGSVFIVDLNIPGVFAETVTESYRRLVSSVGWVPDCRAGGRWFESWPD